MAVEIREMLRWTGGETLAPLVDISVNRVSTDTRLIEKNDVFFALSGARFDGHDFIAQAMDKGAKHFIVSDRSKVKPEWLQSANFILVRDTLAAYGDAARQYRQKFRIPAVAITGSVGKTTVKELVAHLLFCKFKVLKNRGTENNLIGVPKTIFQLEADTQVLVVEMGTNAPGEIERLSEIIRPQIGIVTQIGHSHLEGLGSLEGVREEKLKILKHLERGGLLIVNGEDPNLANVQSAVHRIVPVAYEAIASPLQGRHNTLNARIAVECARALGVEEEAIRRALAAFKPVPGRMTPKMLSEVQFLDDSYNSNPTSFRAALETLKAFPAKGRRGVVCGDMLELGAQSESFHREMGTALAKAGLDFVIAAGPACRWLADAAVKEGYDPAKIFWVADSVTAGKVAQKIAQAGDVVLVKGSRSTQMERVFECFTSSYTR